MVAVGQPSVLDPRSRVWRMGALGRRLELRNRQFDPQCVSFANLRTGPKVGQRSTSVQIMSDFDTARDGGGLWGFANRLLILLIVLALLAGAGLSYLPLIQQNRGMRVELETKRALLSALQAEHRRLQTQVNALQNDPKAVERAAREQGVARPGETIIRFEPQR
ncbi:MAG TPA: hypothetical protein DCE44_06790 [Verrucomicrobiales bacterium]|nr:hypothetical protein [Verrucomicrobiales bacterium]